MPAPGLLLGLFLAASLSLATWLETPYTASTPGRSPTGSLAAWVLGDSRRLIAAQFFGKADEYFHSGYYPTIFDVQSSEGKLHMAEATDEAAPSPGSSGPSTVAPSTAAPPAPAAGQDFGFLGPPRDWIDRFGRHFFPSRHTHLDQSGNEREILPWLRLSASLDPQRVETYTVAAYWLRHRMGKVAAAEQFLREGWRVNPDSYEILFELGRLYDENLHDRRRARNLWELALRKWQAQENRQPDSNRFAGEQILAYLARLEERDGQTAQALCYLLALKPLSPHPQAIQKQIDDLSKPAK